MSDTEEVIKNVALLDTALAIVEQFSGPADSTRVAEFVRIPLIANSIARSLDDDYSPADTISALEMLIAALREVKFVKNVREGFEVYDTADTLVCHINDEAEDAKKSYPDMLTDFREAMDRIKGWVAQEKYKFGRLPRKSYYAAVQVGHPSAFNSCMNWMHYEAILKQVVDRIRKGVVQEEP